MLPGFGVYEPDGQRLVTLILSTRAPATQLHSDARVRLDVLQVRAVGALQIIGERVTLGAIDIDTQDGGFVRCWLRRPRL